MIVEKTPQNYKLSEKVGEVALDLFLRNVLSRAVILMLKDQFCDYEDINVLTPVRSQAMTLIQRISQLAKKGPI